MKKITTSIKIPKSVVQKLLEQVVHDGYGMKGKSIWISEAIDAFLKLPNYPELVDIATDMEQLEDGMSTVLSEDLIRRIDQSIVEVRKNFPSLEGVKSNIIRASIMQRLVGG